MPPLEAEQESYLSLFIKPLADATPPPSGASPSLTGRWPRMESLPIWIKAFHILSVIAWMAGMLYLPRLFVYHAETQPGSEASQTFKTMGRRLLKGIINPAMIATWLSGLYIAYAFDF